MIVTIPSHTLRRPVDEAMFTDITTVPVVRVEDTGDGTLTIEFGGDLTADQVEAVKRRLQTANAQEEALWVKADAALDTNRTFRDTTSDQLVAGAQLIIDDASMTQAEVVTYVRDLARAVKTLTNHVEALSRQNIVLIRMAVQQLEGTE